MLVHLDDDETIGFVKATRQLICWNSSIGVAYVTSTTVEECGVDNLTEIEQARIRELEEHPCGL